ncbi:MAG: 1-deoxy-D-xylulose 5-phosphate synthase (EC [uncultured Sulfurovum sp.]|uniref:1-deoxy-D-xylulose-5-phosphate synthase n=1 Tax=uncultured Sulfurovum sp. TaxID=269237 RepID=A0A6S6T8G7_9BACT|nr:MAG: 1-deoxy-D-xylulose 5-phosphate synthase (EC [uncultured Sulfurovum sp.]
MMSRFGDLKTKTIEELEVVADEVREKILSTVSKNGGHLSSTLGATDIIVAMHAVFDAKKNPFIFDVSHQAYAHKLVTNRWDEFDTLRQFGGVSGYTKPKESECDYYMAGHSSTSISLATGAAKAIALNGEQDERVPLAVIGDGSMSAGMVYEAMNELGDRKDPAIIILNDNEMSIASPIGALSRILSQKMASPFYQKFKEKTKDMLEMLPDGATYLAKRFEESFHLITPGILFEELGLEYIGPIDGHNIESLVETLKIAKSMNRPVIMHTQTTKGKGYEVAEGAGSDKEHWHGVGIFDVETGVAKKKTVPKASTAIFAETLVELADNDDKVVGVTAAMPSGTGMSAVMAKYPERFWDVAIAEQHAVTSMGPLAKEGFKPFCTLYSTFLQRGYDQLIHDICLMNLGVAFAIDRAGIVGEDGETHQGVFDVSYLRAIPNMTIFAPSSNASMKEAMLFAKEFPTPCAFRYPRGAFSSENEDSTPFELGKSREVSQGEEILFVGYGNGVGRAEQVAKLIEATPTILDLRFVKPLDETALLELAKTHKKWYVFSDTVQMGGVGSAILELLAREKVQDIELVTFEYTDNFITHGNTKLVEESLGLLPEQLAERIN